MPTLNRLSKKPKSGRKQTDMRKLRQQAYNNTNWRKTREEYLMNHPCCERHLLKGEVVPAEDIHHKKSPFINGSIDYDLLLDSNNLEALCKECHGEEHAKRQGKVSAADMIRILDELFGYEDSGNN